jgi:Fe-S oxidoreductase
MEGKTMCPSYRVTREEMHTTRGRAHLLFEMLQGKELARSWRDEHVKESLDLCLACKGCKGDCPVNVDLATYKAEFLAHYYEGRLRPRYAYVFGCIDQLCRLGSVAPRVANFFSQTPGFSNLMKAAIGLAAQRQIPKLATQTFRRWFQKRSHQNGGPKCKRPPVILWADTFNNYFYPSTAQAAVEVLEAAGFQVYVPPQSLCCGRPLYDFGMLDRAQRLLRQVLDALRPMILAGVPMVGLEPSCVSVFRDELKNLFPEDQTACKLAEQTLSIGEFFERHAAEYRPPQLKRKAMVHGHCHHKALWKMKAEEDLLKKMGLDFEILDSGCCGMAGSFGFEKDKYDVSQRIGELVLLPAVRNASSDTLIIADGFSCREQIAMGAGREAVHLSEVLQLALHQGTQAIPLREAA